MTICVYPQMMSEREQKQSIEKGWRNVNEKKNNKNQGKREWKRSHGKLYSLCCILSWLDENWIVKRAGGSTILHIVNIWFNMKISWCIIYTYAFKLIPAVSALLIDFPTVALYGTEKNVNRKKWEANNRKTEIAQIQRNKVFQRFSPEKIHTHTQRNATT